MNKSFNSFAHAGKTPEHGRRTFTARRLLIAILAALAMLATVPTLAQANVGLGASSGNRTGDLATPVDFGNTAQASLPKQITVWLYNDNNTFLSAQASSNDFNITGSGFRRNGGSCNGAATGTTWTSTISGTSGITGSGNSCSIILEIQSGSSVGAKSGTITFASNRTIENGTGNRALSGNVTEENGAVIRVYGPGNETASYDFGGVATGDSSTRTFTLKNTGTTAMAGGARALTGTSPDYSITGTTCGAALAVLSSCTVDVKFMPTTVGPHAKSLDFTSSSGHSRSIPLAGTGFLPVADISVTPMTFDYGNTPVGYPFGKSYTVSNTGNTTLDLSMAIDAGPDSAAFSRNVGAGTCGATLNVGNSCTMNVEFNPNAGGAAAQSGSFTVTGSTLLVGSPATRTVNVTGTRTAANASIEPRNTAGTVLETNHSFGTVAMGSSSDYTFTVTNTGNVPIPNITPTLTGQEASNYSLSGSTCGSTIPRGGSCQVTVTVSPTLASVRRARLVLTPGAAAVTGAVKQVNLTTNVSGIKIKNDVVDNLANTGSQKRWLESLSLAPGGTIPSDVVRVAFEVELPAGQTIDGVDIVGNTTTDDSPPSSNYQNITDLSNGEVQIDRKPGSTQALIRAEVPLNSTSMGVSIGNYGLSTGTDLLLGCSGGTGENTNRRVWFRVRGSGGGTSATVGSVVRFHNQQYACPYTQGPNLSNQRILSVGGTNLPGGTNDAAADKNQQVTFQFNTRTYGAGAIYPSSAGTVDAVNWRIRNAKTGDTFRIVNGVYTACAEPCTAQSNYDNGARFNFPTNAAGVQQMTIPGIPTRGRWVVEGSPQGSDENDDSFFNIGTLRINDHSGTSPTLSFGGTLGTRPDTDTGYTISAAVADPADPTNSFDTQGGRAQIIEWDLNGIENDGVDGEGFEFRSESDPGSPIPSDDLVQAFSTVGKTPGPYAIRARVTDNGSMLASDGVAESKIFTFNTTINSPPVATAETVDLEADHAQPTNITFNSTDVDNDPYRVTITPNGSNDGSLAGNLDDALGQNTKPYSWPADYTGSDTFSFVSHDDHNGSSAPATLTIKVRPNTTIDTSTITDESDVPGILLHPDLGDPAKRFLGSTTDTKALFDFSSPQHPVNEFECRHLNDGVVVNDWTTCSNSPTGQVEYSNLDDGLHRVEIRAINDEGEKDGTPVFRTWRVDNTSPVTEVRIGPPSNLPNQQPRMTNDNTPTYIFKASSAERSLQDYVTYECRVLFGPMSGTWIPCGVPSDNLGSGPVDLVGSNPDFGLGNDPMAEGTYSMEIRATDEVGNLGAVLPETFIVDTTPPITALASGAEGLVNTRDLEYVLSSSEGQSTFTCKVERRDPGPSLTTIIAMAPCPGPAADGSRPTFTVPTDGEYILTAIATDPATNPDPTPLEVEFEVDATEPTTTLDPMVNYGDGPTLARRTQSRKIDVTFTGNDTRQLSGFQCRLDSTDVEAWTLCQSVQRFGGLSDGSHKLEIRARDEAANFDSTPEEIEWVVDRTPPVTSIDVAPDAVDNDASPDVEFSVNETATSECRLDGGSWSSCSSPVAVTSLNGGNPLSDGPHSFNVRSTDTALNMELTPAAATWSLDTTVPEVTITSSPNHFVPVGDVSFGWVVKDGSPLVNAPEADSECSYDAAPFVSCERSLSITNPANGQHTLIVRATDAAGNVSPDVSYTFEVLGAPPAPAHIDNADPVDGAVTRLGNAGFAFSHEDENEGSFGHFECRLDGGSWSTCQSPYEVQGLADGAHSFEVRAHDIAGNISPIVSSQWDIQAGAPVTTIDSGPNGLTNHTTASLSFSSNKAGTFECRIDGAAWGACTSPVELADLTDGEHSARVRAVSTVAPVGVKDPTPPLRTWTVDTAAPDVTINSAPSGAVVSSTGTVTFSSTDDDATFLCKLGTGIYDSCASPKNLTGLTAGEITFAVKAIDAAGNESAEPATTLWTVENPTCPEGQEGTPPACTDIPEVTGPGIKARLTGGELSLATLGAVDLAPDLASFEGKRGTDGRWYVPKEGVNFEPVIQSIPDVLGPGTSVDVEISISATGAGRGTLPTGGGASTFVLPVRADVQAKLGEISVIEPGTECGLKPITFNLAGTYDEAGKTVSLTSPSVSFPKITGCGSFKETIDSLLELPRNDISLSMDLSLEDIAEPVCEPPTTGTPPDCVTPPTGAVIAPPVVTAPKKVKSGKFVTITSKVANTGGTAATSVKVCLALKKAKKLAVGKANRCKTVASIAAGSTGTVKFKVKTKKVKSKKKRLNYSVSASAATLAKPKSYVGHVTLIKQ